MAESSVGLQILKVAVPITEVTNITGPGLTRETIDVTDLDDTWRQFIAGLKDGGEVSFDLNYDPDEASHAALVTDFIDGSADVYNIVYQGTGADKTWTGTMIVVGFEPGGGVGDKESARVTLKVTGAVTTA